MKTVMANTKSKQTVKRPRKVKIVMPRVVRPPRKARLARLRRIRNARRAPKIAPNAFEPGVKASSATRGTYAEKMVDYTRLSPALQFELACANPGQYRSPFVEGGRALDVPTQILAGFNGVTYTPLVGDATYFNLVAFDSTATTVYSGNCGVHVVGQPSATYAPWTLTTDYLGGTDTMATYFGTSTYSDKILPFAMSVSIEILAPAAVICGVVHIGSVSVAALPLMKFADYRSRATTRLDLKTMVGQSINLRACIANTTMIHNSLSTTSAGYTDEWVTYALFENVAMPLTPGNGTTSAYLAPYKVSIGVNAQAVWWPDGNQPAMAGLAISTSPAQNKENSARKAIDDENADALSRTHHHPTVFDNLASIVSDCLSGVSISGVLNVIDRITTVAPMVLGAVGMLLDPKDELSLSPILEEDIGLFQWEESRESKNLHFSEWTPNISTLYDTYMDSREALISAMTVQAETRRKVRERITHAEQRLHNHRGKTIVEYFEADTRMDLRQIFDEEKRKLEAALEEDEDEEREDPEPPSHNESSFSKMDIVRDLSNGRSTLTGRDEFTLPDGILMPKILKKSK